MMTGKVGLSGWLWATVALLCGVTSIALAEPASQHQLQVLAGQGDANAQWMLGQALLTGDLGMTDDAEAVRWLQLAADQGHGLAQRDLGLLYELGRGVDQDSLEAFFWYSLASRQDSGRARLRRDALAATLTPDQQDAVMARLRGWRPKVVSSTRSACRFPPSLRVGCEFRCCRGEGRKGRAP